MNHLPYQGTAPPLNALVAGHIQVMFTDLAPSLQLIRRGKLRALGITTAERAAAAPEIPPLAEVGVPGYDAAAWSMLIAPAKTPRPILTRLKRHRERGRGQAAARQSRRQPDRQGIAR
jgi:tripartite-type tricarboxylate transporter receptor subunit TctC